MNEGLEENTQTEAWGKNDGKYSKASERQKKNNNYKPTHYKYQQSRNERRENGAKAILMR